MNTLSSLNYTPSRSRLTEDRLRIIAPSIYAESPVAGVSDRYAFVPTSRIVENLRRVGWEPVEAREQRVRLPDRRGFQKHLLRFQRTDIVAHRDGFAPELVLLNSHDRSSAYQLHAGLFRFICSNGMIVADSVVSRISIRHTGFTADEVTEASLRILEQVERITDSVATFRRRELMPEESTTLATLIWRMRFPEATKAPIEPATLLRARRTEDEGNDLWRTLNRIQENALRGGQRDWSRRHPAGRRLSRTRGVTGLDQAVRLNKGLWDLAHRLAKGEMLTLAE